MKFQRQTRFFDNGQRGNCFPACIASFMEIDIEDVFQVQEHYDEDDWNVQLWEWLDNRGWNWRTADEFRVFHSPDEVNREDLKDKYYMVTGASPRNIALKHCVIYRNGEMVFDPHPDDTGILSIDVFEILERNE